MKFTQALFAAGCAVLLGSGLAVPTDELTNEEKVRESCPRPPVVRH
jgi:hypothetical protein